jgi:hypothetical protein
LTFNKVNRALAVRFELWLAGVLSASSSSRWKQRSRSPDGMLQRLIGDMEARPRALR